ncbi:cupin domain-containing protein [Candidatus Aenigmatarchaeota archaeon]
MAHENPAREQPYRKTRLGTIPKPGSLETNVSGYFDVTTRDLRLVHLITEREYSEYDGSGELIIVLEGQGVIDVGARKSIGIRKNDVILTEPGHEYQIRTRHSKMKFTISKYSRE